MRSEQCLDPASHDGIISAGRIEVLGSFLGQFPQNGLVENGVDIGCISHAMVPVQVP
jgi:hypothetical protein